jgi:hypothetical protein
MSETGPLTRKVIQYQDTVRQLVPTVKTPEDWAPLADLIAIDHFERIGTFREVQNWQQYAEMLTGWANSVDSFETTVKRVGGFMRWMQQRVVWVVVRVVRRALRRVFSSRVFCGVGC